MLRVKQFLVCFLVFALVAQGQGNTFNKVRYNGGSVSTKVKPDDWDNKLTVNSDAIVLALKDGQTITILPKQVTSLSYGQEAHRRVGTAIGLAVVSLGAGLLFTLHKTKLHYIGVNYTDKDGKSQGILLQGDKSNFRAIIAALQGVTGAPVSVSEKERGEIPAGITVQTTKEPAQPKEAEKPSASGATPATAVAASQEAPASISISSNPDGAEISVDDAFSGNTPSTLKLRPGKHNIRIKLTGYKDWTREIAVEAGSEVHLTATLEKQD
jgi:hypothetical protein